MAGSRPVFCGLLPHPPVVVPAVGGVRVSECRRTLDACRRMAAMALAARPHRLVLVSPHAPRREEAFGLCTAERLYGDLGRFGAPQAAVDLPNDGDLVAAWTAACAGSGVGVWSIPRYPLDHGAVVPLWFLVEAGWNGPTAVASLPWRAPPERCHAFGRALREALAGTPGDAALIASGDCTHRALPGAPSGFDPRAVEFDRALEGLLASGRCHDVAYIDPALRERAAEDAADPVTVVAAALDGAPQGARVLSYEHPFGVGYLVAVLDDPGGLHRLPAIARAAIAAELAGRPPELPEPLGALSRRAPVFVTLRDERGRLRGCIGSQDARTSDLVQETAARAVSAAFSDPRFPPLRAAELNRCRIEVSVLSEPEPVTHRDQLDPHRFGVAVRDEHGRGAVLLPDIEGIDTVDEQLRVVRRKAGIDPAAPIRIARFTVEWAAEPDAAGLHAGGLPDG